MSPKLKSGNAPGPDNYNITKTGIGQVVLLVERRWMIK